MKRRILIYVCRTTGSNLACKEWQRFFGDEPYNSICPDLPYPKDCGKKEKPE